MTVARRTWMRCRNTARKHLHLGVAPHLGRRRQPQQVTLVVQGCSHHQQAVFIDTARLNAVPHWTGGDRDEPRMAPGRSQRRSGPAGQGWPGVHPASDRTLTAGSPHRDRSAYLQADNRCAVASFMACLCVDRRDTVDRIQSPRWAGAPDRQPTGVSPGGVPCRASSDRSAGCAA